MAKLTYWSVAVILLCWWCWPLYGSNSMPQYSSIRVRTNDTGEIVYIVLYVILLEIGKKLDKGYKCPVYCDIDHKHYFREKDEDNYEQEGHLQTTGRVYNTTGVTSKEQPAGSL